MNKARELFCLLLVLLLLLPAVSGCQHIRPVRPATAPEYVPGPLLEPSRPVLRPLTPIRTLPDLRQVSSLESGEQQPLSRTGFRQPVGGLYLEELFLQDLPLSLVAELLNEVAGANLVLLEDVSDRRVRVHLRQLALAPALEAMLRSNRLWFREEGPVTMVMDEEAYADNLIFQRSEKIQAFFMRYSNARDMAALLAAVLEPEVTLRTLDDEVVYGHLEAEAAGGGEADSGVAGAAGAAGAGLSAEERRRLLQLGATEQVQDLDAAGRVLGRSRPAVVTVFKKNNAIVVRSSDEGLLRHISGLIREMDTPVRQVLLEVRIVRLQLGDGFESFFDISRRWTGDRQDGGLTTLGGGLDAPTLAAFFSRGSLDLRLQLFARQDRLQAISSPFLMAADNAAVRFFVGEQVPLRTGVAKETVRSEGLQDLVFFMPQVQSRELGTDLEIKSFINADRTITLELVATIEAAKFGVSSIPLINDRTGQVVNFPLDGVDKNELRSIIAVPAGDTVALSGFIRLEDQDFEQKVPLLGDLPGLGYFFKRVERRAARTETLILITPWVMGHADEGAETTRSLLERGSRAPGMEAGP